MEQPIWLERLAGSTRLRILELLRGTEGTVQELAHEVGISANAIRGHLSALERDGLIEPAGERRDTGGKPAATFRLSREGDELFPKAYAVVLSALLDVLDDRVGSQGVRDALEEVGRRAATASEGPPERRVEAAAEALRGLGGKVEIQRTEEGFRIQGYSCALAAVTREDPRMCVLAEALVRRVTGASVREVCDRSSRPSCAFEVLFSADPGPA